MFIHNMYIVLSSINLDIYITSMTSIATTTSIHLTIVIIVIAVVTIMNRKFCYFYNNNNSDIFLFLFLLLLSLWSLWLLFVIATTITTMIVIVTIGLLKSFTWAMCESAQQCGALLGRRAGSAEGAHVVPVSAFLGWCFCSTQDSIAGLNCCCRQSRQFGPLWVTPQLLEILRRSIRGTRWKATPA